MRGKKPLSSNEVKSLRKLLEDKPLHSLLLNIGVDTMLRGGRFTFLKNFRFSHRVGKGQNRSSCQNDED